MLTAISCGVMAPMSRPIGAWTRGSASGVGAFLPQRVEDALHLGPAADQADVSQLRRRERAQRVEVVLVAARDDDRVGRGRQLVGLQPRRNVVDDDVDAVAEALGAGELLAIVDDVDAEAGVVRHPRRGNTPTCPAPKM